MKLVGTRRPYPSLEYLSHFLGSSLISVWHPQCLWSLALAWCFGEPFLQADHWNGAEGCEHSHTDERNWIMFLESRARILMETFSSSWRLSLWQSSFPSVQESHLSTNRVLGAFILLLHPRAGPEHSSWLFSKPALFGNMNSIGFSIWIPAFFNLPILSRNLGTDAGFVRLESLHMTFWNHQPDGRCDEVADRVERYSNLANWVKMSYFSNLKNKQHVTMRAHYQWSSKA